MVGGPSPRTGRFFLYPAVHEASEPKLLIYLVFGLCIS